MISKENIKNIYELSSMQQTMLFESLASQKKLYYVQTSFDIENPNIDLLEKSFQMLVDRHDILRTIFSYENLDKALQVVLKNHSLEIIQKDFSNETSEKAKNLYIKYLKEDFNKEFRFNKDFAYRISFIILPNNFVKIAFTTHHILLDAWSISILENELFHIYSNFVKGVEPELKKPHQFNEYIKYVSNLDKDASINYWNQYLVEPEESRLERLENNLGIEQHYFSIKSRTTKGIYDYNAKNEHSIASTILTLLGVVFNKYYGSKDFILGNVVTGRSLKLDAVEEIAGLMTNTVPQRVSFLNNDNFVEISKKVNNDLIEHQEHSYVSLAEITQSSDLKANTIDHIVTILKDQGELNELSEEFGVTAANFTIVVSPTEDEIYLNFVYNSGLFHKDEIISLSNGFTRLAEELVINPDLNVHSFELFTIDDLKVFLKYRNGKKSNYTRNLLYEISKRTNGEDRSLFDFFQLNQEKVEKIVPLTVLQNEIYYDSLFNPKEDTYHIGVGVKHIGEINIAKWKEAIETYMNANDIMRSYLLEKDSIVFQAIKKPAKIQLELIDFSEKNLSESEIYNFIWTLVKRDFPDPTEMYRHHLIKIDEKTFYSAVTGNNKVTDAMTGRFYYEHISQIYMNLIDPSLAESEFKNNFIQYIFKNNDEFNQKNAIRYWKDKLKNVSTFSVDTNKQRDEKEYYQESLEFSPENRDKIKAFCWENKITLSFYFRTVYSLVLHDYYNTKNDFVIFENVHGRDASISKSAGVFMYSKTIIVENEKFANANLKDYFNYFRRFKKESRKYEKISLGKIQEIIGKQELNFFYNYLLYDDLNFLGQKNTLIPFENSGNNEVHFFLEEKVDSVKFNLLYNNTYFSNNRLLERIKYYSDQILSNQVSNVSEFELILEDEKKLILNNFNNNQIEFPVDKTFAELFEKEVLNSPEKIAVICNEVSLTYQELNEQANSLARHLIENYQIGPGSVVGILMDRSELMLISILAIFKASAAYIPIDTEFPESRISYLIKDAEIPLLIIHSEQMEKVLEFDCAAFVVDLQLNTLQESKENLNLKRDPNDLAYIIYTSGSTGNPKGASIEQKGMVNHLYAKIHDLNLDSESIVAQNASHCFDISVWQFLVSLLVGGKTVVYQNDLILESEQFLERVYEDKITILEVVPSYLNHLIDRLETIEKNYFELIKHLMVTGETLKYNLVKRWFQLDYKIPLVNAYGPTEASDDITHHFINELPVADEGISIGKPIPNMKILILDENLNLRPIGFKGEICVTGIGVGKGYINNKEKTDLVFIDNPYKKQTGEYQLYKTGDLGSWNEDGSISFFGRKDYQIKIRGFRIELGEIESKISDFKNVRDVAVLENGLEGNAKQLIAYLRGSINIEELRKYLATILPVYMIPSQFIIQEEFPLTPNGKIDRKKLLSIANLNSEREFVEPKDELESLLLSIWQDVLATEKISVTDDFFDIGGNSLQALALIHKLKLKGYETSIANIFEKRNIREIAEQLNSNESTEVSSNKEEIVKQIQDKLMLNISYKTISSELTAVVYESNEANIEEKLIQHLLDNKQYNHFPDYFISKNKYELLESNNKSLAESLHLKSLNKENIKTILENLSKENEEFLNYLNVLNSAPANELNLPKSEFMTLAIEFNEYIETKILEKALVLLFKQVENFNITFNENEEIIRYESISKFPLSLIDLKDIQFDDKISFRDSLIEYLVWSENNEKRALLLDSFFIELSYSKSILLIACKHSIMDRISIDLLTELIKDNYSKLLLEKSIDLNAKRLDGYSQNISQMLKHLDLNRLNTEFHLEDFASLNLQFKEKYEQEVLKSRIFSIELDDESYKNNEKDYALKLMLEIAQMFYGSKKIPFYYLYNGREYQNVQYFNLIGDFTDFIPMYFNNPERTENLSPQLDNYLRYVKENHYHFNQILDYLEKNNSNISTTVEALKHHEIVFNYLGDEKLENIAMINDAQNYKQIENTNYRMFFEFSRDNGKLNLRLESPESFFDIIAEFIKNKHSLV